MNSTLLPRRDTNATSNMIDLSDYYNGLLSVAWSPAMNTLDFGWDLSAMPVASVILSDVHFDVRGLIHLRRVARDHYEAAGVQWAPPQVSGIRISQRFHRLHSLHGAVIAEQEGAHVGSLILHYAGGREHELEIIYGRDVRDWFTLADAKQETERAVVAWMGTNLRTSDLGGEVKIYKRTWENPHPDDEVVSVDFVSKVTRCGPFLIALTVEP